MKFFLGIVIGLGLGGYLASNMTEQQRAKVGNASRRAVTTVKDSKVVTAVADNASKVTDEVTDRVAGKVDEVGDKVAETVSADPDAAEIVPS
jgi:hypothetical protein